MEEEGEEVVVHSLSSLPVKLFACANGRLFKGNNTCYNDCTIQVSAANNLETSQRILSKELSDELTTLTSLRRENEKEFWTYSTSINKQTT